MQQVFKSFGLALVGTMHPRMLWLSLRPFLIVSILWGSLIWLTWTSALEMLNIFLTTSIFTSWIQDSLIWAGFENARAWIAPLFFVMLLIPLIAISLLVFIAFTTVPTIVKVVTRQHAYKDIERKRGGGLFWKPCLHDLVCFNLPCIGDVDFTGVVDSTPSCSLATFDMGLADDAPDVLRCVGATCHSRGA
ncbi:EI24 domain-containing protein [Polynucleobacter necessarius]|uniref:EI24 domain-containing protein n=1 Tax=Polynucleobacter necessarius TaxID=576610 RepID=UPI002F9476C3